MPGVTPFRLQVDEPVLDDLRRRLESTRWPDEPPGAGWRYGTDVGYLRDLVAYWQAGFDWRSEEARLNEFRQFTVRLGEVDLHFIHEPGRGPDPLPLLVTHGWPSSVWEFYKLIPRLTDPSRFGGDPADAFTVVAPSLPGYPLSFRPGQPRCGVVEDTETLRRLMLETLGYRRFVAHGGDWGAFITARLAALHPDCLHGIHLTLLPVRRDLARPAEPTTAERAYHARLEHWLREESGYIGIQGTKPQTLAFGLADSPAGLAGWIVEKFRTWSDSEGQLERVFTRDEILTNVTLYWVTGAIGASFWPYYQRQHEGWPVPEGRIEVPTGHADFPREIIRPPREVAERFFNVQHWTTMPRGGHFAALETPDLLAEDLGVCFRRFRGR